MNKKVVIGCIILIVVIAIPICVVKFSGDKKEYTLEEAIAPTYVDDSGIYKYEGISSDEELVARYASELGITGVIETIVLGETDEVEDFLVNSGYTTFYTIYNNGTMHYFVIDDGVVKELSE